MANIDYQSLHASTAAVDPLLTGKEAAPILGMSYPTFLRKVREGMIPKPLKLGALSRWPQSEILSVIEKAKAARTAA
ncbi:helix-turn-helix transcriptional regulator [Paenirhodobacter populi]|nr:DNA-binding protein [Sinirhodobacter populi]